VTAVLLFYVLQELHIFQVIYNHAYSLELCMKCCTHLTSLKVAHFVTKGSDLLED
jgi:hypothetical protein